MKKAIKALAAGLCFVLISFMLVSGTFALPDLDEVFQAVGELFEKGIPEPGGEGTNVHVSLVSNAENQRLFPGGSVSHTSHVENVGSGNVYFRLVYAIQYEQESWKHLNIRFSAGEGFTEHGWMDITVSGTPYKMKVFTYNTALAPQANSSDVRISIDMDTAVTSEQISRYRSDFLKMQVLAIDPAPFAEKGFSTAAAALDMALPLGALNPF